MHVVREEVDRSVSSASVTFRGGNNWIEYERGSHSMKTNGTMSSITFLDGAH